MKKQFLLMFWLLSLSIAGISQDIHFSQFYNSPLTLNPALTGKMNGNYRVAVNYRNQWFGMIPGQSPFVTPAVSFDMPILFKKDALGLGALVVNDQTGGGRLNNLSAMLSASYHKALGFNHSLSLGAQLGYAQKRIDYNNLQFGTQWKGNHFNNNLPSGESVIGTTNRNFDMNTGLLYTGRFGSKLYLYAGYSIFHVTRPKESFLDNIGYRVFLRHVAHAGIEYRPGEKISLLPSFIYMTQGGFQTINAGASVGFHLPRNTSLYLGGYYRVKDAVIVYYALEFKGVRLGVSYDFTTSWLREASQTTNRPTGSVELALVYTGKLLPLPSVTPVLFCPRF